MREVNAHRRTNR